MRTDNITPPYSTEAEQSLIGACLISSEAFNEVTELLTPEDFYDTSCRIVYEAIKGLSHAGKPSDLVTVSEELKTSGDFERIGGMVYLAGLMSSVATTANIISHAQIVLEYSLRRRMLRASDKIAGYALKFELDSAGIISESERELLEASRVHESSNPVRISELTPTAIKTLEELHNTGGRKVTGYSTGFTNVDSILSGFQPGSLNIIAARPSMGKTALALNMAQFGGENDSNPHVLLFSLEMSSEQLIQRMLSAQSGIKLSEISSGQVSDYDFLKVCNAAETLNERNIFIHDTPRLSATDFTTQCRRFKTRHPELALIVVDYLQLMHVDGRKGDNRQQETADISRALKGVAVELCCPVLALSQLSREVERRTERKPQLSDLRDSGAIEQDADTVMLLYREDYYDPDKQNANPNSRAELRIAKNRTGRTGICRLTFRREYTRFTDYTEAGQ